MSMFLCSRLTKGPHARRSVSHYSATLGISTRDTDHFIRCALMSIFAGCHPKLIRKLRAIEQINKLVPKNDRRATVRSNVSGREIQIFTGHRTIDARGMLESWNDSTVRVARFEDVWP